MKITLDDGQVIDTDDHKCDGTCVFCDLNNKAAKDGFYVIPFDIPGVYDKSQEPHVKIVKINKVTTVFDV